MNTRKKEHAYQQPDPSVVNQHSEQGAMYEAVNEPPAIVNQNFDYEIPPGDVATTGSLNQQQTPKSAANVNQNSKMVDKVLLSDYMTVIDDGASNSNQEASMYVNARPAGPRRGKRK